jgi:hypothetical protein
METPRIKPEEQESLFSQVQFRQRFAPKLVPFVHPTDARKTTVARFGRSDEWR